MSRQDGFNSTPRAASYFDDQYWPTNIALLIWGGILAAIFVSLGGFNDSQMWRNGVIRLLTLLATMTLLMVANNLVRSPWSPRLRLAAIGSLILHTLIAVGLYTQALAFQADPLEVVQPKPGLRDQVFPRLAQNNSGSTAPEKFEQPVEVSAPGLEREREALERTETRPVEPPEVVAEAMPTELPAVPEAASSSAIPEEPRLASLDQRPATSAEIPATVDETPLGDLEAVDSTPAANPLDVWQLEQEALVLRRSESVAPNLSQEPVAFEADILEDLPVHSVPRQHLEEPMPSVAPITSPLRSRRMFVAVPVDVQPPDELASAGSATAASATADPSERGAPDSTTTTTARAAAPSHAADAVSDLRPGGELLQLRRTRGPLPFATDQAEVASERTRPSTGSAAFGPTRNPRIDRATQPNIAVASDDLIRDDLMETMKYGAGAATERRPKQTTSPSLVNSDSMAPPKIPDMGQIASLPRSGPIRQPAPAYAHRGERGGGKPVAPQRMPATKTELAIERGLDYLARLQFPDGHWSFHNSGDVEPTGSTVRADASATGLALLAFFGAGYDHIDGKHAAGIKKGIEFLVRNQGRSGSIIPAADRQDGAVTHFYSHGIATLALCEAYGMTGDAMLREPAQRALDYVASTQHPQFGGWRYTPGVNADLSVTGWQLTALRSGQLAGLEVSGSTIERIRTFVERCREEGGDRARFRYNPWASPVDPATRHGLQPSTVMTSVGLLMDFYLGRNRTDRTMQVGADHLLANPPALNPPAESGTIQNPGRDTYYWYYATQVMFHMGGNYWRQWHDQLHGLVTQSQVKEGPLAGSWDPLGPTPDKWAHLGGRLYVTSLNLLSLEVSYRYLPLYEVATKGRRQ